MHLEINPQEGVATLKHGKGVTIGTLEFETYRVVDDVHKDKNCLDIAFHSHDLNSELTVKDFLKKLLLAVWKEEECFDGKRPFGNSRWKYDLFAELVRQKVISGELDKDGYVKKMDDKEAHNFMCEIIKSL